MDIDVVILKGTSSDSLASRITEYLNKGYVRVGDLFAIPIENRKQANTGSTFFVYSYIQQMERRE